MVMLETIGTWLQSAYAVSVLTLGFAWALTPALARRTAAVRHHVWAVALAIAIVAPVARGAVPRLNVPLLRPGSVVSAPLPAGVTLVDAPRLETRREAHVPSPARWSAIAIAALMWMLGAVPLLCVRGLRRVRLSRLVADAKAVATQADVRSHARVGVPMLAGLRRPTILLPLSASQWPIDTREAVLVHERAHAQRYDHVMALVSDVATTVYWLNPLAWIAATAIEREREAACDEEVLRAGIKPSVYASVLLTVADTLPTRRPATVPSIAGGRLDARIRAVLHQTPHSGRVPLSWPATLALIGGCALLVGSVRLIARTPARTISAERPTPAPHVALRAPSLVTDASPDVEAWSARRPPVAQAPSQPAAAAPTPATATPQTGLDSPKQDEPSPRQLALPESQPTTFQTRFQSMDLPRSRQFVQLQVDTKGVEFGPWFKRFILQVFAKWNPPPEARTLQGQVVVTFHVHKSGALTDVIVVARSPVDAFNTATFGALVAANPTPPLPPEYPDENAAFTVTFSYNEPLADTAPAQAQGRIAGRATDDSSGAGLHGVTVTVASEALTAGPRTVTTDSDGAYMVANLPPGIYTVEFTLMEHVTVRREQLELANGVTTTVYAAMKEAARIRD
jgi:TonB family protein